MEIGRLISGLRGNGVVTVGLGFGAGVELSLGIGSKGFVFAGSVSALGCLRAVF